MHIALVLGGDPPRRAAAAALEEADLVVCTDGGAHGCLDAGRTPDIVIGDMDSIAVDVLDQLEAAGVRVERHPRDKGQTDGELGLEHAVARRPQRISILGGTGGRTAMVLSHIGLLVRCAEAGVPARWLSEHERVELLASGSDRRLRLASGTRVDLVALEADTRVQIEGFRYSGNGIHLPPRSGLGISNVVEQDPRIRVSGGSVLLVVETP